MFNIKSYYYNFPRKSVLESKLYWETIFREALEDAEMGIKVNGVRINNICYAGDRVLIIKDLKQLVNFVGEHSKSMDLNINTRKTIYYDQHKFNCLVNSEVIFDAVPLKRVDKFKYLGKWLLED